MATIPGSAIRVLHALATTLVLAACATQGDAGGGHGGHHRQEPAPAPGPAVAPTMSGHSCAGMGAATGASPGSRQPDMQAMCAAHAHKANAPAARGATAEQHMKGMSPKMRERHLEMMRQHCK